MKALRAAAARGHARAHPPRPPGSRGLSPPRGFGTGHHKAIAERAQVAGMAPSSVHARDKGTTSLFLGHARLAERRRGRGVLPPTLPESAVSRPADSHLRPLLPACAPEAPRVAHALSGQLTQGQRSQRARVNALTFAFMHCASRRSSPARSTEANWPPTSIPSRRRRELFALYFQGSYELVGWFVTLEGALGWGCAVPLPCQAAFAALSAAAHSRRGPLRAAVFSASTRALRDLR